MIQKTLLATAAVAGLAVASVPAYAAYYTTFDLEGDVSAIATGSNTFSVNLTNLDGNVSIQVPPSGTYAVDATGSMKLTVGTSSYTFDSLGGWTNIYSGLISSLLLDANQGETHNFVFGSSVPSFSQTLNFGLDYDGEISNAAKNALNGAIAHFLGSSAPTISGNSGSGSMAISATITNTSISMNITESDLDWTGFTGLIWALGGQNGINGSFEGNGTLRVPEPTTLALLGLGVLGLGLSRSRKAKAA